MEREVNFKFFTGAIFAGLAVVSINAHAALISTLSSSDNLGALIAGDQSNTTAYDWATASVFHVGSNNITVESMTATFGNTNSNTAQYLEIGIYESTGTHGSDLQPGALFGTFDTSTIYSSNSKFSIDLAAHNSFELQADTDYLLVWNAQSGAPYLGKKRRGTPDQMVNDGIAGHFTGELLYSLTGGSDGSWYSKNQYGFDYASINGTVSTATLGADIPAVPVPAAVWLFGSGLLCLAGFARRSHYN
jgi:hypothetical protein